MRLLKTWRMWNKSWKELKEAQIMTGCMHKDPGKKIPESWFSSSGHNVFSGRDISSLLQMTFSCFFGLFGPRLKTPGMITEWCNSNEVLCPFMGEMLKIPELFGAKEREKHPYPCRNIIRDHKVQKCQTGPRKWCWCDYSLLWCYISLTAEHWNKKHIYKSLNHNVLTHNWVKNSKKKEIGRRIPCFPGEYEEEQLYCHTQEYISARGVRSLNFTSIITIQIWCPSHSTSPHHLNLSPPPSPRCRLQCWVNKAEPCQCG